MNRVASVFSAFETAAGCLRRVRPAVPLTLYFLFKLGIILLYTGGRAGFVGGFWKLLRPGEGSEALAHYPNRLLVMPAVLGRLDIPVEILVLSLVQGVTVLLVAGAARGERIGVRSAAAEAAGRWIHLAFAAAIAALALFALFRYPVSLLGRISGIPRRWEIGLGMAAGLVIQAFFIYAVPFIMLEKRSSLEAVRRSVIFAARHFIESVVIVLVPFILTLPTLLLTLNPRAIAFQISPEFLVQVQIVGELLDLATGYILVGGIAIFMLKTRGKEETL